MKDSVSNPLLFWCIEQTKNYSFVNITNFTTSWKDGIAFCALLHKYFPDLIEISTLKAENAVKNLELAFFVAETKLDVPVLINPQSLVSEGSVDKELVVDYISKLYKAVTCKCQEQMWSNTSVDKQLSLLYDEEVALPLCCLCGQSIFRLEELTVFNKKYHRSCYRENQLNTLKSETGPLKSRLNMRT
uniref:Calponin-homology (CH) domain-containing protein n=1 Tax=Trichobilharzia regenti TaxID=157069 RepID=A0AA85JH55_TRIRE|nr:unnamed protein product [Trichobilharzia regenti]